MTPLERAARALYRLHDAPPQDLLDRLKASGDDEGLAEELAEEDEVWPNYVADVRAILEALREPSEAMVERGQIQCAEPAIATDVWEEMIDAALKEG